MLLGKLRLGAHHVTHLLWLVCVCCNNAVVYGKSSIRQTLNFSLVYMYAHEDNE